MATLVDEETSLSGDYADPPLTRNYLRNPDHAEDEVTIAYLLETSDSQPNDPDFSSPYKRRRKSKPTRFEVARTELQKEHPPQKIKIVVNRNIPTKDLRLMMKAKSPTKKSKTPIPPSPSMIRAEELQLRLGTEFPSCVKVMGRSQVTQGFWMGLPVPFCRSFLPKEDTAFVLEDEMGEQWEVKYIAYKTGISAGWKNFVDSHGLIEGDVLVFHLIELFKLKIYIIRVSECESNEVDGALNLLNLDTQREAHTLASPSPESKKRKLVKQKYTKSTQTQTPAPISTVRPIEILEHSGTNSEEEEEKEEEETGSGSEILEASTTPFHSFQHFRIKVNGQSIDSELPEEVKLGYYKLCLHKKQFLHDTIRENLYHKLVAGMIGETVNIAKEIKNCKLTISKEELEAWDNSLMSFEILGMKVGFLREKIKTILGLVFESEFGVDVKKYVEAKKEEKIIENEIFKVKGKLLELKIKARNFEGVLGGLKEKAEKYMIEFRDEVDVPW